MRTAQVHRNPERPIWTPIYMGEQQEERCYRCYQVKAAHIPEKGLLLLCDESFLRIQDGNR